MVIRLTHTRLQIVINLTTGFMLGVALLHILPHAIDTHTPGSSHGEIVPMTAMMGVFVGFVFIFFIERFSAFIRTKSPNSTTRERLVADAGRLASPAER